jgi:hypothetical protein
MANRFLKSDLPSWLYQRLYHSDIILYVMGIVTLGLDSIALDEEKFAPA